MTVRRSLTEACRVAETFITILIVIGILLRLDAGAVIVDVAISTGVPQAPG